MLLCTSGLVTDIFFNFISETKLEQRIFSLEQIQCDHLEVNNKVTQVKRHITEI